MMKVMRKGDWIVRNSRVWRCSGMVGPEKHERQCGHSWCIVGRAKENVDAMDVKQKLEFKIVRRRFPNECHCGQKFPTIDQIDAFEERQFRDKIGDLANKVKREMKK